MKIIKINMNIKQQIAEQLKHDKLIHFFVGFFTFYFLSLFFGNGIGFLGILILSLANEMRDEYKMEGGFDCYDILFSILPAIFLIIKDLI